MIIKVKFKKTMTIEMTKQKISEYVQKWMDGHEPDTFVRNENGKALYTAKYSTLNIQIFFENLLADFINDDEIVLTQSKKSLKDRLFNLANDFAVDKKGDVAVKLHIIHNELK